MAFLGPLPTAASYDFIGLSTSTNRLHKPAAQIKTGSPTTYTPTRLAWLKTKDGFPVLFRGKLDAMNHIVRGRLLLNVTLAALLLGLLFIVSKDAQSVAWPVSAVVLVLIGVQTALQVRTSAQVAELRQALNRVVGGELEETVPLGADEPLGSMAELLERLRKQLFQRQQEFSRQITSQSKTSSDLGSVLSDLRNTISQQMHALEETGASLHEMTTSAKQIAQSVETLARGAEESSSSILEMAASNDEVAENMVNLAGAVQESATSIEEMTYSIREVAKNVEALSATAEETSSSMNEMDISIRQVENNANETARL